MKASLRKLLISTTLTLPCSYQAFALNIFVPSGTYNGNLRETFPYTITSNPEGTTAILIGDLNVLNIDNSMAATPLSCFSNSVGPMTIVGRGHKLTFTNLRTSVNGAALSSTPPDATQANSPYSLVGLDTLSLLNCVVLSAQAATGSTAVSPKGGGVYVAAPLFIADFQNLLCQNNRADNNGGALWAKHVNINGVKKNALFTGNVAAGGGAIGSSHSVSITNCPSLLFRSNSAEKHGGAIHSADTATTGQQTANITLSKNGSIQFDANVARSGGAIYCEGNVTFSNNRKLLMQNNFASPASTDATANANPEGQGGAIFSKRAGTAATPPNPAPSPDDYTGIVITNQTEALFANNVAATAGGAVFGEKVTIESCGPTMFRDNRAASGGAISVSDNGSLKLSADYGDMVFYQNLQNNGTATPANIRNSISLSASALITSLSASGDHSLFFYDPIVGKPPTAANTQLLEINPKRGSTAPFTNYIGSVVFSGLDVVDTTQADNLTSTIYQKVNLSGGKLVLANNAKLAVTSFTQDQDSVLLMDNGTTLEILQHSHNATAANADGKVVITNLHLNIASFTTTGTGATIEAKNAAGDVTASGSISLDDATGHAYENHALFNQNTVTITPLVLAAETASKVTTTDLNLTPRGDVDPKYGYQGSWTLSLEDSTDKKKKTLKAVWNKRGFTPSPERHASLVPNSLWGTFIDLRSINELATTSCDGFGYGKGFWVAGISNIFHHDRGANAHGFRRISNGYVLGANSQTISDSVIGVAFAQLFGKSKDYVISTAKSKAIIGTGYLSIKHPISNTIFTSFSARASYSHTNEDMKTRYTFSPEEDGSWVNNCWLGEIGGSLPIVLQSRQLHLNQIVPFVNGQVGYAEHGTFKEKLAEARFFCSTRLINVSVPCGFKIDRRSHNHPDFYSLSLSYVPDVYRRNPGCKTLLLANGVSWNTTATNLDRHALLIQGSSHTAVNNNIEIFSHGSCELRKSSRNYNINLGSKFRF
ncbi:polymorphic outer membrane protein middle domain-containing protein [Chlamydia vaughanii]|uniref:polymorphic outer membrane protein middle domain-containing protein n=1 Tax=Chlamydia vaughanii TaxID=3112552 RepID=UPI0032B2F356